MQAAIKNIFCIWIIVNYFLWNEIEWVFPHPR